MRFIAKLISYVFNPLVITTVIFYLLTSVFPIIIIPFKKFANVLLGILFVVTFLVPLISLVTMRRMGVISDIMIADRTQRTVPLLYTSAIYFASAFMIFRQPQLNEYMIWELLVFVGVLMLIVAGITRFWKISAHATGMGGVLGLLFRLVFMYYGIEYIYALMIAITITGLVISARLFLNAHTPYQTLAGMILGAVYAYVASFILL